MKWPTSINVKEMVMGTPEHGKARESGMGKTPSSKDAEKRYKNYKDGAISSS